MLNLIELEGSFKKAGAGFGLSDVADEFGTVVALTVDVGGFDAVFPEMGNHVIGEACGVGGVVVVGVAEVSSAG